jgi:beta-hydroxyacyl-ACP dehydratase FabZ
MPELNVVEIMKLLPHRYPFLMVDKVLATTKEKITAIKNVTINEPFFQGHFPKDPIMPGVLLVEGMAQCSGILSLLGAQDTSNLSTYFTSINNVKFKEAVRPGDTIRYEVELVQQSAMMSKFKGEVYVKDDKLACRAEFAAAIVRLS